MTTRARLEDPDVSISDILTPEEESVWRLGGASYRLGEKIIRSKIPYSQTHRYRFGLVKNDHLVRVVGTVTTETARNRIWKLLPTSNRRWPPKEKPPAPPLTPEQKLELLAAGRARAAAKRREKTVKLLATWRRKLKLAQGKVRKYERAAKRMERTR